MALVTQLSKGKHPQADNRRTDYFKDQHGRVWWAPVDMKTGDPVSALKPLHWTAPLEPDYLKGLFLPPEQYRLIDRSPGEPVRHRIDYEAWIADWTAAYNRWDQARVDIVNGMTNGLEVIRQLENPSPAIRRILGPGPFPPAEVISRMAEGDPYALGLSRDVPRWFTPAMLDELITTARQTRLFSPRALRKVLDMERKDAAVPDDAPPKTFPAEVLKGMSKEAIVEIAEQYQLKTAGETKPALIDAILAAQGAPAHAA